MKRAGRVPRFHGVIGALVYLLGTTILPGLHVAFHRADHDHFGGGIRFHADEVADHDDDADDDHHDHEGDHHHDPSDHDHGDGSLAHFAAAIGEEGVPAVALAIGPTVEAISPDTPLDPALARDASSFSPARAPPLG